jgi:hypothetical protein
VPSAGARRCLHPCRALADEYFAVVEIKGPELAKLQLASLSAEAYSEARRLPPGALR